MFDAVSYLVSLLTLTAIRGPFQGARGHEPPHPLRREIAQGITEVRHSPFLRAVVLVFAFVDFAFPGAMFTVIVVLRQAGNQPSIIGLAQGLIAVGGLLGALAASWLQRRAPFRRLIITTIALLCACLAVSAALSGHLVMVLPITIALFLACPQRRGLQQNSQPRRPSIYKDASSARSSPAPA